MHSRAVAPYPLATPSIDTGSYGSTTVASNTEQSARQVAHVRLLSMKFDLLLARRSEGSLCTLGW